MHEEPDITDSPDAKSLGNVKGEIAFHDVTFSYDERKEAVLEHVDLHINPGEMLALVGPAAAASRRSAS